MVIYPVRRIPFELWAQIFVLCLPDDNFVEIDASKAPLLLGQVCSSWREITLSTPALWSSICLGGCEREFSLAQIPLVETWLRRSGNLPLSIQICHPATPTSSHFLDILIPFSSRWYNLDLHLPQSLAERIVGNNDLPVPTLTTLSLWVSTLLRADKPLLFSRKAISLRNITLLVETLIPSLFNFPWAQITEFRPNSIVDTYDCFEIFRLCPQLIRLQLRNISSDQFDGNDHALARMPQLSWLHLVSYGSIGPLLDNLVVPSLREIHLEVDLNRRWPKTQLLVMLSRSSSPLEVLTIHRTRRVTSNMAANITELFESIQTLQRISVAHADFPTTSVYARSPEYF
ncbi:hypothetical protein PILCRDRAFT_810904 [Piloderma croceum F 1598]|uniref:Uncharacterized protein n=1 Tax=Piloderma croceum (strain F 1598) TaxID=765440 RepID=A0A0C3CPN4_PILCF|nr:hypothetical protein PILCRDRAFT_810904 [Piloderma croceum F 1598]